MVSRDENKLMCKSNTVVSAYKCIGTYKLLFSPIKMTGNDDRKIAYFKFVSGLANDSNLNLFDRARIYKTLEKETFSLL